jgi:hypothetical protein
LLIEEELNKALNEALDGKLNNIDTMNLSERNVDEVNANESENNNTDINQNANEGFSLFSGEHLCSKENTQEEIKEIDLNKTDIKKVTKRAKKEKKLENKIIKQIIIKKPK